MVHLPDRANGPGDLIRLAAPAVAANAAKQENAMRSTIQATPAYELSVDLRPTRHGHHLRFVSFVATARRPEEQVRFQAVLTADELRALRSAIDAALDEEAARRLTS
jgi:hypothetical protein